MPGETALDLPANVVLDAVTPPDDEEVSPLTPRLEWTPVPGATAYEVSLESSAAWGKWFLPSGVSFIDLPDLGEDLFRLPSDRPIWWSVVARASAAYSSDELTDPIGRGYPPVWESSADFMVQGSFSIAP